MRNRLFIWTMLIAAAMLFSSIGAVPVMAQAQDCDRSYTVESGDTLSEIALFCGVSYSDLIEANPDIDNPQIIYPGQVITIPSTGSSDETTIPVTGGSLYIVQPGDTLDEIAGRFNVTTQAVVNANPWLEDYEQVSPGMRLTLPRGAERVPTLSISPVAGSNSTNVTIAATGFRADTDVLVGFGHGSGPYYQIATAVTDANGAVVREMDIPDWAVEPRSDYVFVVQNRSDPSIRAVSNPFDLVRELPDQPGIPNTGGAVTSTYTVRSGDTLFEIAQMYNTTLDRLLELNPSIDEASLIYPGQTINLPQGARRTEPYVTVSDDQIAAGAQLKVKAYNFPARAYVDIRLVPEEGRYIAPYDARSNAQGSLIKTIRIPQTIQSGEYRIVVTTTERRNITRVRSELFEIQGAANEPNQN